MSPGYVPGLFGIVKQSAEPSSVVQNEVNGVPSDPRASGRSSRDTSVRAVDRALDVLLAVARGSEHGLGVTEVAARTGLYKSTAHRLLGTLEARGFVRRNPGTERYHLGLASLELAGAYLAGDDLIAAAMPEMERLRDEVGETVSLYIRDGHERVRVQKVEGRHAVRRVVQVGQRLPLCLGASGKVLLAHAPEEEVRRVLAQHLPEGLDAHALRRQLEQIRRGGFGVSVEEREPGTAAVAAPVRNRHGEVVAALCISGPSSRLDRATLEALGRPVAEAAERIARLL